MKMNVKDLVKSLVTTTRAWRERILRDLQEVGCSDLSYRPHSGMSSLGWLLAHQGAAYDYTLNMLIKGKHSKMQELFYKYRGDSNDNGDWKGTSLKEIEDYYDFVENDFLTWFEKCSDEELNRILEETNTPQYYKGMRIIDAIADTFVHLNHHNGHLSAIKGDWCRQEEQ